MPAPPDIDGTWISADPPRLQTILLRCARGELPANVALMHLAMAAESAEQVDQSLRMTCASLQEGGFVDAAQRICSALDIWRSTPDAFPIVMGVLNVVDHNPGSMPPAQAIQYWAAAFDRAATVSPEASVALYSLGNRDLLEAVTDEVAARMADWDLLGPDRTLLDIGCGIGRFVQRLAPWVGFVVGIDISARMTDTAHRRCGDIDNAVFVRSSGRDLAAFADASFDALYAIDSFPYLVQSGGALAARHIGDAARILKPGGRFLIINYAYDRSMEAERAAVMRLAEDAGLAVLRNGTREFTLWDGRVFLMQRVL